MVRILGVVLFVLAGSACFAQSELDAQRKSLESLPAISFDQVMRCVKPGDSPTTATVKFGDTSSGTKGKTFTGNATMTFSWPAPGIYREMQVNVQGAKFRVTTKDSSSESVDYYDGSKSYRGYFYGKSGQIHVEGSRAGSEPPEIQSAFRASGYEPNSFTKTGTSTDPKFGTLVHFEGRGMKFDVAPEKDYMTVRMKMDTLESQVLEIQQIEGHWVPTSIKQINTFNDPVEVYTTLKNIKPLAKKDQVFKPEYKPGMLIVENGTYFDVASNGSLVKSKNQPDRTTEYLTWAGMAAFAIFVLSVIVIGLYKLFRKPQPTQSGNF